MFKKRKLLIKKRGKMFKTKSYIFIFLALLIVAVPFSSAGFLEDLKAKITGEATSTVTVNVTVGLPPIKNIF